MLLANYFVTSIYNENSIDILNTHELDNACCKIRTNNQIICFSINTGIVL